MPRRSKAKAAAEVEVRLRPYLMADARKVVTTAEEIRAIDPGSPHLDAPRWRYVCADPYADPEETFRLAETEDGRLAGFAYRFDPPRVDGGSYRAIYVVVHPEFRRQGVGTRLFEATLGDVGVADTDEGWYVSTTIDESADGSWPFAKSVGFKRDLKMMVFERELPGRPLPDAGAPIRVERFVGAHAYRDWAEIHNAAFDGQPHAIRHDPDDLEDYRPDGFRPDHVRFAKVEGKRVGYLFLRETTAAGHIESIGVIPEYRGRGIATSLLISALEYLIGRGHSRAELAVDERNKPALKMYARLEFDAIGKRHQLRWRPRGR